MKSSDRPQTYRAIVGAMMALIMTACMDEAPMAPDGSAHPSPVARAEVRETNKHIIIFRGEDAVPEDFLGRIADLDIQIERVYQDIGVMSVSGLTDQQAEQLLDVSGVQSVTRDLSVQWSPSPAEFSAEVVEPLGGESDQTGAFYYANGRQWNIRQIDADDAWFQTPQGEGATVAILDSGIDPFHGDLDGKVDLANSASMLSPGSSACNEQLGLPDEETIYDFEFHGTFVAGQVATNGLGMASVAPDATLWAVKVLDCTGSGSFDDVIAGILYAADRGADVINMSLGAVLPVEAPGVRELIQATQRAVNYANERKALVVAASGNDALNLDENVFRHVPSQLRGVISVGATGPTNQTDFDGLAPYSNYGLKGVDVTAPGGNVGATNNVLDGVVGPCSEFSVFFACDTSPFFYLTGDGTSFASPHAAGAAAVIESTLPGDQAGDLLGKCLLRGADKIDGLTISPLYGRGRINVLNSVSLRGCGRDFMAPATDD
jgi:lantibiotic leader peptide-processing serine protease